jgi:hypothetical protein
MSRELMRGAAQQRARAVVDALDHVGHGVKDEDGLRDSVEDLPESIGRLEGSRVLDRRAGARRQVSREGDVAGLERPAALRASERDRPQDLPGDRHRRTHPRPKPEMSDQLDLCLVTGASGDHRLRDLRDDHGLASAGYCVRPDVGLGSCRVLRAQLLDVPHHVGIAVGERQRREPPLVIEKVEVAPVGDRRDDQVGDLAQRRGAIEGRAQDPACIGEVRSERILVGVEDGRHGARRHRLRLVIGGFG